MKKLCGLIAALLLPSLVFGQAKPETQAPNKNAKVEQELIKLESNLNDAFVKADLDTLNRLIADDYFSTDGEGSTSTKEQMITSVKSGETVYTSAVDDDVKARVWESAAVVTGRWTVKEKFKGKDASGQFRYTDTWIKRVGHWQCVASHISKIETK